MTNFTVLVCNRLKLTKQALESLEGTENITVTISEDIKCDTDTSQFLQDWTASRSSAENMVLVNYKELGTGALRNQVIQCSETEFGRGDYLYLSDSDVFFHHNWLTVLIDCYEVAWNRGCRVIGGVGHPYHQHGESLGVSRFNAYYGIKEVLAQPLQSMLMRWEVWDKYGPFNETPVGKVCQGEDVDFTNLIRADGYKIGVVDPAVIANTGITNSFGDKIPGYELVRAQCPPGVICE